MYKSVIHEVDEEFKNRFGVYMREYEQKTNLKGILEKKYGNKVSFGEGDRVEIETPDFDEDLTQDPELRENWDFSVYAVEHPIFTGMSVREIEILRGKRQAGYREHLRFWQELEDRLQYLVRIKVNNKRNFIKYDWVQRCKLGVMQKLMKSKMREGSQLV